MKRHLLDKDDVRRARERVEALLEEGLRSKATPMTKADWAELHRKLAEYIKTLERKKLR